jgi:hypothetical protein
VSDVPNAAFEDRTPALRKTEVTDALLADQSTLGNVYRLSLEFSTAQEIAEEQGAATVGYVYYYLRAARCLQGERDSFPNKPSVARQVAGAFRRLLKRASFSDDVRASLERDLTLLEQIVADEQATVQEEQEAQSATIAAESEIEASPGATEGTVYVYSLPHYLRHRVHAETGRTYLKVGKTIRDPERRITEQARQTGLPEEPIMLRTYRSATINRSVEELERAFHFLLVAADHERPIARSAGKEWFITTTRFTDAIAKTLGLEITQVSDLGD